MVKKKRKNKKLKILENIYIEKVGYGGIGVSKIDIINAENIGKKVIIKGGAIPGSLVDIVVLRSRKDFIEGRIKKVHSYDKYYFDKKPFCKHFFYIKDNILKDQNDNKIDGSKIGCGGCKWQTISYKKQLQLKENIVKESFNKVLSNIDNNFNLLPIIGSDLDKGYRNKIEFSFGKFIQRKIEDNIIESHWNLGFHKQGEFSKIVDIDSCGLICDDGNLIFEYCKNKFKDSGLPVYDQMRHEGFFRHFVIRNGFNTGQTLVNLVVSGNFLEKNNQQDNREMLKNDIKNDDFIKKNITTFIVTYNNGLADVVRSSDSFVEILMGDGHIYEKLIFESKIDIAFRISPFSFFQTNTYGAQKLFYNSYKILGNIKGTILDLYCGTGTIGLSFLKLGIGNKLVGIEVIEDAITDARHNAKINGLDKKSYFLASSVEKAFVEYPDLELQLNDLELVILDPPREGLHQNIINFLGEKKKEIDFKILYISCNPVTMARDTMLLLVKGFKFKVLQPVDMFPQTHHIECIGKFI